ncbi:MAG TPA: acyltransferase [Bacteroidia bacterium]|jgi:acetyltransferase-like isoleucine patch superfamily enzyme|nr:acyltransferase [Bacteroidia bacterium]
MPNIISGSAVISKFADLEESVKGSKLIIGDKTVIDSFVKIKFAGGLGDITIGDQCYLNSGTVLYCGNGITIGNKVLIAANCTLAPVNHGIKKELAISDQPFMESRGGIVIEDDVWLGANVTVLDGARIRRGCVVGAGSLVSGTLEEYGIYVGNPLKLKGFRK